MSVVIWPVSRPTKIFSSRLGRLRTKRDTFLSGPFLCKSMIRNKRKNRSTKPQFKAKPRCLSVLSAWWNETAIYTVRTSDVCCDWCLDININISGTKRLHFSQSAINQREVNADDKRQWAPRQTSADAVDGAINCDTVTPSTSSYDRCWTTSTWHDSC